MNNSFEIPFYGKTALILISAFAIGLALYVGQHIIIPILYATMIAILLNPLVNYLLGKNINKIVSISLAVLLAILLMLTAIYVVSAQITLFTETYPQLKAKFILTSTQLLHWMSDKFGIRETSINAWIKDTQNDAIGNLGIGETLSEVGRMLVIGTLLPVYLFMILYYKPLLLEFIHRLFKSEHHITVVEVLAGSKKIIQSYLVGLFFEMIIVATLNSTGLLLIGIDYAIILGITGAILNVIPYLGGITAIALPMLIAFITKDSLIYPLLVFIVYIIIQFIDNHYVIPKIVASRVQLNALISVIAVLIGGAFWGIPGMFLSIPLTAIMKVIFDHIDPLKPWGFLLGNIVPTTSKFSFLKMGKIKNTQA
ncbi:AI-2E family transporter [Cytophagales bacterium WSM2-2]|nr:AI-2E family transporter [Cytophagales bacterium WSM2-2]